MQYSSFARRIRNAWIRHGWRLFGPLLLHNIRFHGKQLLTTGRIGLPRSSVDRIQGVETHRAVYLSALGHINDNSPNANAYEPIEETAFESALKAIPIRPAEYSFVDLGSGKGRALLLAAKFDFRRVIGVEYSEALHRLARKNLAAATGIWPNVDRIELILADATTYVPPPTNTVLYLYNPFDGKVMSRVLFNWTRFMDTHNHDVWVIYVNPTEAALFADSSHFTLALTVPGSAIFRRREYALDRSRCEQPPSLFTPASPPSR